MNTRNKGFTLVEILIVVLILGILAAVVLPRFSNASAIARASMLADDLRVVRTQLEVFKGQHQGVPPGHPNCNVLQPATPETFVEMMTRVSNSEGEMVDEPDDTHRYGPYLRQMPPNPVNGLATVEIIAEGEPIPPADDSAGWIYQPSTLIFKADSTGLDDTGKSFGDY